MGASEARDVVSLVEHVYDNIRRAILEGRYEPGRRLRLNDIASENNVSFIPIREALRLLEAGRLVEIIPNKGARVSAISETDMVDGYELRIILEGIAVQKASERITKHEVREVTGLYENMVRAFEDGEVETASAMHRSFHMAIYCAARSAWLVHLIELLISNTDRYRQLLTPARPSPTHMTAIRDQHLAILKAVKSGDGERAGKELRRHLSDTLARFRTGLAERV